MIKFNKEIADLNSSSDTILELDTIWLQPQTFQKTLIWPSTPFFEFGSSYSSEYKRHGSNGEIYFISSNSGHFPKHLTFPEDTVTGVVWMESVNLGSKISALLILDTAVVFLDLLKNLQAS